VVDGSFHIRTIREKARRLGVLSLMSTTAAGSGHPTSCLSAAELAASCFFYAMKLDPKDPNGPQNDRFVLSLRVFRASPTSVLPYFTAEDSDSVLSNRAISGPWLPHPAPARQ